MYAFVRYGICLVDITQKRVVFFFFCHMMLIYSLSFVLYVSDVVHIIFVEL